MSDIQDSDLLTNDDQIVNSKYKDGVNRNARLIIRNVSFKATEEDLRKHYEPYGQVEEVKLLRNSDGKLVGCGFVHFKHVPEANKALKETNKKSFLGRPIYVAWAVAKDKFVQQNCDKPTSNNNIKQTINDSGPSNEEKEKKGKPRINPNARLIIRNVSFKATDDTLREHFSPYGVIEDVQLLRKPDGKLVGCGFVQYKNLLMANKAIANTNFKPFLGRPISVDFAIAKNRYMQHMDQQRLELEDKIKKEEPSDSDSDDVDDKSALNISSTDVKAEIKSETGDSDSEQDNDKDNDSESENDSEDEDNNIESGDEDDDEIDEDTQNDDNQSITSSHTDRKRLQLNDAEDGCTVFLSNIPFSIDSEQLKQFVEKTGPVKYALICIDKLTEHSRGTGFVKFLSSEDAVKFLSLTPEDLTLEGQAMQVKPALKRENLQKDSKNKQPKDNRNLFLVKEGVVVAGTKAAVGVSASDMAKRLALERSKTQMLRNLNRFVSRYRLVVSNLPPHFDDVKLRAICSKAAGARAQVTEARVMRHLREAPQADGKHPSKGYGFVMFTRHEDALACLRKLNNNPDVFNKNNRPIVSFSIEDRTALNARKKRLEKAVANNPLTKKEPSGQRRDKRKKPERPDESKLKLKKRKFDDDLNATQQNNYPPGRFVRPPEDLEDYSGLSARQGNKHQLRTNRKLKQQAELHKQNVKLEKKISKRSLKLKMAAKERIKLPKMKQSTKKAEYKDKIGNKSNQSRNKTDSRSFQDLVSKYKTKLSGNTVIKAKWYES